MVYLTSQLYTNSSIVNIQFYCHHPENLSNTLKNIHFIGTWFCSDGSAPLRPAIAGYSPSYLARRLYDFRQATCHGEFSEPMRQVAANLSSNDPINLTAYLASLPAR